METKYVHQSLSTIDFFKPSEASLQPPPVSTEPTPVPKAKEEKKTKREPTPPPRQEDPIYAPIREGKLDEIKKLLEGDANYELVIPKNADELLTPLFVSLTLKNDEIITYHSFFFLNNII